MKEIINCAFFDTETTGLKPQSCHVLTLGFVNVTFEVEFTNDNADEIKVNIINQEKFYSLSNWRLVEKFSNLCIPQATIDVHGITDEEMVKNGIHPLVSFSELYEFLKDYEARNGHLDIICAFNLPFDINMIRSNLLFLIDYYTVNSLTPNLESNRVKYLQNCNSLLRLFTKTTMTDPHDKRRTIVNVDNCVDNLATFFVDSLVIDRIFHYHDDFNKISHNLEEVGLRYGLGSNQNAHNAMADTERLVLVFQKQLEELYNEQNKLTVTNQTFENRLINKFINDNNRWKTKQLDYFGEEMTEEHLS